MSQILKKSFSVLLSLLMVLSLFAGLAVSSGAEGEQKTLTIIADAKMKDRGQSDPPLTYRVEGLDPGDTVIVELERQPGESGGIYAITAKKIECSSSDYTVSYVGANFTIRTHGPHCVCYMTNDSSPVAALIKFACTIVTAVISAYETIGDLLFP